MLQSLGLKEWATTEGMNLKSSKGWGAGAGCVTTALRLRKAQRVAHVRQGACSNLELPASHPTAAQCF